MGEKKYKLIDKLTKNSFSNQWETLPRGSSRIRIREGSPPYPANLETDGGELSANPGGHPFRDFDHRREARGVGRRPQPPGLAGLPPHPFPDCLDQNGQTQPNRKSAAEKKSLRKFSPCAQTLPLFLGGFR